LASISASNAKGDRPAEDAHAIESLMTEQLTRKIVAWATETASYAAELPLAARATPASATSS
jgi:hypothetical protein